MGEYPSNEGIGEGVNGTVKDITNIIKKVSVNSVGEELLDSNLGTGNNEKTTEYGSANGENSEAVDGTETTYYNSNGITENGDLGNGTTGYNGKTEWKTGNTNAGTSKGENATTNGKAFKVATTNLPAKVGFWTKVKNVLFSEIKVELTPYQQKVEDEINEFLHQEVSFKGFFNLFKSKK